MLYLDPGTGSLVIQVVIAALVTIRVTSRDAWNSMKNRIMRRKPNSGDDNSDKKDRDPAP